MIPLTEEYNCYTMDIPTFEDDPEKNRANLEKHGIGFEEAQELWYVPHFIVLARYAKGEERLYILGKLNDKLHVAIFTMRGDAARLISCHRADKRLRAIYEEKLHEEKKN